jgi:hypothetical protein
VLQGAGRRRDLGGARGARVRPSDDGGWRRRRRRRVLWGRRSLGGRPLAADESRHAPQGLWQRRRHLRRRRRNRGGARGHGLGRCGGSCRVTRELLDVHGLRDVRGDEGGRRGRDDAELAPHSRRGGGLSPLALRHGDPDHRRSLRDVLLAVGIRGDQERRRGVDGRRVFQRAGDSRGYGRSVPLAHGAEALTRVCTSR